MKQILEFHKDTPDAVRAALLRAYAARERVRIFYGDTVTGRVWPEENDVSGLIMRSYGETKVPIIVSPGSLGGTHILDHCIIGIMRRERRRAPLQFTYRHPLFDNGTWGVRHENDDDMPFHVTRNGEIHARFDAESKAERYAAFMRGERMSR